MSPQSSLAELLDSGRLAWSILASLPNVGLIAFDRNQVIVAAAGQSLGDRGFDTDLIVGRHLRDVVPAEAYDRYAVHYAGALAGESRSIEAETHDGERIFVSEFSPLRDDDGVVVGGLIVARDVTEPRRNRQEADELRRQWQQAFLNTTRGIAIIDPETGLLRSVNPSFARIHRGTIEDFEGLPLWSMVAPGSGHDAADLARRIATDDVVIYEADHLRNDGVRVPVRTEIMSTASGEGETPFRIAWLDDLTAQRDAQAARDEAAARFESAFANAPIGVALIGPDTRFLRVNDELCTMLGRDEQALLASSPLDHVHPDDLEGSIAALARLDAGEISVMAMERRFLRPDGSVVWISSQTSAVRSAQGTLLHRIAHFQDVTSRREAEERQRLATDQFEAAFGAAPVGMALVGLDGRWMRVNHRVCDMLGYDEAQLLELTFQELTHPEDLDTDLAHVQRVLAGEIDRYSMEKRYFTAAGHLIWVNLSVALVRAADGTPLHFVSQIEDVSERKRLEEQLHERADHDALSGLWNRRRFEEEMHRVVSRCQRYGERAAFLLVDLNDFKLVNDRLGHRAGDTLLQAVSRAMARRLRESDSIGRLGGDEFGLLLTNVSHDKAAQFAAEVRDIVAMTRVDVEGLEVSVTASVGIAFIDQGVVDEHEVFLKADRSLYDAKAGKTVAAPDWPQLVGPTGEGAGERVIRIVHCDDSDAYRLLVREMLGANPDLEVAGGADNGGRVLDLIDAHAPDVVILDAVMVGSNVDLVAAIRERDANIRVVVLSGLEESDAPMGAVAHRFVHKSTSFDALANTIRELVPPPEPEAPEAPKVAKRGWDAELTDAIFRYASDTPERG